ncbi:MAG: hypothetical protein DMF58_18910 [Acidobacteria bacterium]|nr:MAG: hypothetical protein DMF58_18910 [Acidobacteriota bacterium]
MGGGQAIPYLDNTFDVLLCLETLEHVVDAAALRTEIIRVLRPGEICMLATPARLKYLFRPDPHFGIPGLLLLPATTKSRQAHCGSASAMSCGTRFSLRKERDRDECARKVYTAALFILCSRDMEESDSFTNALKWASVEPPPRTFALRHAVHVIADGNPSSDGLVCVGQLNRRKSKRSIID